MPRAALLLAVVVLAATADAQPPSPADQLAALKKTSTEAETAYYAALKALPDTPAGNTEADRIGRVYKRGLSGRLDVAVALAMADPKSDRAIACLEWVLTQPWAYYQPAGLPAFDLATTFHAANPKIGRTAATVGRHFPTEKFHPTEYAAAMRLLNAVAAKNADRTARGQAVSGLALDTYSRFAVAEYLRSQDTDRLAAAAEAAYEALAKGYSDCPVAGSKTRTLGEDAYSYLHELRNLRVGKVAPDIVGDDLDGKRFKLSDSRGQVTVLVFWAGWCGPCMRLVAHERKLAERMRGKPVVLVGVNADEDRATGRAVAEKAQMTWRSFWDGPGAPSGPISTAWNVRSWPEIYVLDAAGVIRFRGVVRDDLDKAVDELVAELEKK